MVRTFDVGYTGVVQALPGQIRIGLVENSVGPAWSPRFCAGVIVVGVQIKLVCGWESNRVLHIIREGVLFHHFLQSVKQHIVRNTTLTGCQ